MGAEIINIPPIPVGELGKVAKDIVDFRVAREEFSGVEKAYHIMSRRFEEAKLRLDTALIKASNGHVPQQPLQAAQQPETQVSPHPVVEEAKPPQTAQSEPHKQIIEEIGRTDSPEVIINKDDRQDNIDRAIEEINTRKPETEEKRTIIPPEKEPETLTKKYITRTEITDEVIANLRKMEEFSELDVRKELAARGVPKDMMDEAVKGVFEQITADNLAKPKDFQLSDEFYEKVLSQMGERFDEKQLKAALQQCGVEEGDIKSASKQILQRISQKEDKGKGLIGEIKERFKKKPVTKKQEKMK